MKKLGVLAALCLLVVFGSSAQGIGVGIKGGLNMSTLSDIENNATKTGFHFGAYARIKLGGIGLQPEAYYSAQGSKIDAGTIKESIDTKYLNIPVLLRFNPVPVLNFHLGPQFGVLMGAEDADGDIKDQLKSSDLSAVVGAGIDLPFGLNFTLRYVKGLSKVNDAGTDSVKNNTFQISVGYDLVKLGK
ncbi:porin family protein [Reichenbachiella sp. MALMAid0571]|uniref:porin family protein n=1 Tax=Reichenbachiella sp. MALMAid0571 TaxID=3143939 RepID=UPI0032E003F5